MTPLVRPYAHGDRRDETEQDVGQKRDELVKVCGIGIEEFLGPEGGEPSGEKE